MERKWSVTQNLKETVKNPNIIIKGVHSYYSNAWGADFEDDCVRYLYGDEHSLKNWISRWEPDKLYIGDYVCIGAQSVILMGGNSTHRMDWFSCYPFSEYIEKAYQGKGDTVIADGAWIGMRALILPGTRIWEGAVVGAGAVAGGVLEPYTVYAGNPAREIKKRFSEEVIARLLKLKIYDWPEEQMCRLRPLLCSNDIDALEREARKFSRRDGK